MRKKLLILLTILILALLPGCSLEDFGFNLSNQYSDNSVEESIDEQDIYKEDSADSESIISSITDDISSYDNFTYGEFYSKAEISALLLKKVDKSTKVNGHRLDKDVEVTKSDVDLSNVDNKSEETVKSDFTGSISSGNEGFATGGDVYAALSSLSAQIGSMSSQISNMSARLSSMEGELFNKYFPVGSTYISFDSSFNPNDSWSGTWEKVNEGTFIEATETSGNVATTKNPGLPNIMGSVSLDQDHWTDESTNFLGDCQPIFSGAFYNKLGTYRMSGIGSTSWRGQLCKDFSFKASRGQTNTDGSSVTEANSVYGKSNTVQPKSILAFVWRRVE